MGTRQRLASGLYVELRSGNVAVFFADDSTVQEKLSFFPDEFDALAAFLRANSPAADARRRAAERVRRYREQQKRNGNANSNVKVTQPSEDHRQLAASLGFDVDSEWSKYRDWQANVPAAKRHKNLSAGFNNWLRKAVQFAPKVDKRERVAEAIWGDRAPSRQRLKSVEEIFSDGKPAIGATYERIS